MVLERAGAVGQVSDVTPEDILKETGRESTNPSRILEVKGQREMG